MFLLDSLPSSEEIWDWLQYGIPVLIIGVILILIGRATADKEKGSTMSWIGVLGVFVTIVGVILCAPILEWAMYFRDIAALVVLGLIVIGVIIFGLLRLFKGD